MEAPPTSGAAGQDVILAASESFYHTVVAAFAPRPQTTEPTEAPHRTWPSALVDRIVLASGMPIGAVPLDPSHAPLLVRPGHCRPLRKLAPPN
jgi:hypothetical protein